MIRIVAVILIFFVGNFVFAQNSDTLFEKHITGFTWMPDGSSLLLNVIKIDKQQKSPPVPKKFKFDIQSTAIDLLPVEGGGLSVSPDGNSVAYVKQFNGQDQIYQYTFKNKEEKLLVNDTLKKYGVNWSPDSKNLVYNIQTGRGASAKVEIYSFNIQTNKIKEITKNSSYKCYAPVWNIKNDMIVYTVEKGDKRDQIFLTDKNGSFHLNVTNDTSKHNYSPYWMNEKTIIYIQAPGDIMTVDTDGSKKQRIEGLTTTQFRYNASTNKIAYLDDAGNLVLFDLKNKTKKVLIQQNQVNEVFKESYYN